jgi:hypothetical protein
MKNDLKLIISGFAAGLLVGAFALTSVGASVGSRASLGDRLPAPEKPALSFDNLDPASVKALMPTAKVVGEVVEYYDQGGALVYRSDPAVRMTTVARGAVIPSATPQERDQAIAGQHMVEATPPAGGIQHMAN